MSALDEQTPARRRIATGSRGSEHGRASAPTRRGGLGRDSVALGGPKQRALLAMLALEAGSTVSVERLIDGLWGDDPPATAAEACPAVRLPPAQGDGRLRRRGAIATRGGGYELRLGRVGWSPRSSGCWRRVPARGAESLARPAAGRRRRGAVRRARDQAPGRAAPRRARGRDRPGPRGRAAPRGAAASSSRCWPEEPLRERLHGQRMLALYRSGRQADALEAYRQARATLVEPIGVEPGPDLRRLHDAILRQDPSLDAARRGAVRAAPGPVDRRCWAATPSSSGCGSFWWRARGGRAGVLVTGGRGMGKTRLAAELAPRSAATGGGALAATGRRPAAHSSRGRARPGGGRRCWSSTTSIARPAHCGMPPAGWSSWAAELRSWSSSTREPRRTVAAHRREREDHAGALDADGVAAVARPTPPRTRTSRCRSRGLRGERRRPRADAPRGGRVGAARRRRAARRAPRAAGGRARRVAARRGRAGHERGRAGGGCASAPTAAADAGRSSRSARSRAWRVRRRGRGFFFGRERLVAELVARLAGAPLMGIVGPSGSGKSSALRAGLLPALAAACCRAASAGRWWCCAPASTRCARSSDATAELLRARRWMLAVDQFEEVFTACRDEHERPRSSTPSSRCARDPRRRALVLLAVRADFYGRCAAYPELARLLGANHVLVGPMRRDELRRAIELPARRAGLGRPGARRRADRRRRGRARRPAAAVDGAARALAARDGRRLRLAAYEQTGGVAAPSRGWPSAPTRGSTRPARSGAPDPAAAGGRGRRRRARAARRAGRRGEDAPPVLADARRPTACSRSARARSRSRTRRCCASGRGCAAGSRTTPRAAACTATCATPRATGTPAAATPASSTAARAWPPRSTGRPRTTPSSTRPSARSSTRAARRASARSAACALVLAGVACLLVLAVIAGRVALDAARQRPRRGDRGRRRSASARRRSSRTTSTARCCSPARAWRSTTRCRRAATCSPRCSRARPRSACCAATATG